MKPIFKKLLFVAMASLSFSKDIFGWHYKIHFEVTYYERNKLVKGKGIKSNNVYIESHNSNPTVLDYGQGIYFAEVYIDGKGCNSWIQVTHDCRTNSLYYAESANTPAVYTGPINMETHWMNDPNDPNKPIGFGALFSSISKSNHHTSKAESNAKSEPTSNSSNPEYDGVRNPKDMSDAITLKDKTVRVYLTEDLNISKDKQVIRYSSDVSLIRENGEPVFIEKSGKIFAQVQLDRSIFKNGEKGLIKIISYDKDSGNIVLDSKSCPGSSLLINMHETEPELKTIVTPIKSLIKSSINSKLPKKLQEVTTLRPSDKFPCAIVLNNDFSPKLTKEPTVENNDQYYKLLVYEIKNGKISIERCGDRVLIKVNYNDDTKEIKINEKLICLNKPQDSCPYSRNELCTLFVKDNDCSIYEKTENGLIKLNKEKPIVSIKNSIFLVASFVTAGIGYLIYKAKKSKAKDKDLNQKLEYNLNTK